LSHPLAFANQCLYHGRLLLAGWQHVLAADATSEAAVTAAYAPVVRRQLLDGYGWLLLAVCRIPHIPEAPPHTVRELPPLPAGLVHPAEVETCADLEARGWVGDLQRLSLTPATWRPPSDRLASDTLEPSLALFEAWVDKLAGLSEMVASAIDES